MKKITVQTDLIKRALPKLGAAIQSKATLPAIENILCQAENGNLTMTTTDLEMMVRYSLICQAEEASQFYLPFHVFSQIVKLCREDQIEFEVLKTSVKVKSGTDVYTLKFNAKLEIFPELKDLPKENDTPFDYQLLPMVSAAVESVAKSEARPQLQRVCLRIHSEGIDVVATDAHILYRYSIPGSHTSAAEILLSPRMVKALEGLSQITIKWSDGKYLFETPEVLIIINRPEFKYVDYNLVIPRRESNLKVNAPFLLEAFQKMNLSSYKDVTISFSKGLLKAEVEDKETGIQIKSEIPVEYTGSTEEILLDSNNVLRLLHQTQCEQLELSVQAPTQAVVFRGEDPNYLSLIIPSVKL